MDGLTAGPCGPTCVGRTAIEKEPDAIVKVEYGNFVREPLRTYARDEVQRRNGLEVKDALIAIGDAVLARIQRYAAESPFIISSVVVGNVQYPEEVATAVSRKLAATQELQRKDTEIEIERKERTIPVGPMVVPLTFTATEPRGAR